MNSIRTLVQRHPLAAFFILAYALSWWLAPIAGGLFPFGPLLAAILVEYLTRGKTGLKTWWCRVTRWRGRWYWYALAIVLPFAVNFAAAALAVLFGAAFPPPEQIARWPELFITFPLYLILFGPLGEEPGWRGFAMPRLQENRPPLVATLLLGLFIAIWHLPLVLSGQQFAIILLAVFAVQIMYTWLANRVEGRVLIVLLAHAAQGGLGGEYFSSMFSGADARLETWMLVAVTCLVSLAIVLATGARLGEKDPAYTASLTAIEPVPLSEAR